MFTQEQLEALNQSIRGKRIKIEILNYNFKIIDTIEGEATEGTIDMDATSDYRMSCSLTMVVDSLYTGILETKYLVDRGNIIWLDKYIKIYVGIDDIYTGETVWYNRGIYIIDQPSYSYSITQSTLKINGMDLMFNLSDKRRGQLTDYETKIIIYDEQSGMLINKVTMRETFINILTTYTNITKYYIAPLVGDLEYLPENLTFEAGITVYDMLSKLLNYLPNWEMFFDLDGVFTVQPIPNGVSDTIYPLDVNNTSVEEISVDFSNVKNLIVVRGRTHDCDYFVNTENGDTVYYSGRNLVVNISGEINLSNNITLGFVCPDNTYNPILDNLILNGNVFHLYDFEGTVHNIPANTFQPGSINVIRFVCKDNLPYIDSQNYWDYLSNDQVNAFAVNDVLDSPFYINAELKGENYYGGLTYCANHINYQVTLNNESTLAQVNDGVQITLMPNIYNKIVSNLTIKDGITQNILLSQIDIVTKQYGYYRTLQEGQWDGDNTIYILRYNENSINYYKQDDTVNSSTSGTYYVYNSINNTWDSKTLPGEYEENKEYFALSNQSCFVLEGRLQTFTSYLSGGEYENIYSTSLAKQRAEYELYLHSNLNDQVSIDTIPNYCMDVNKKVIYKNFTSNDEEYYLTKTISLPLAATGATMNIASMKIYPQKYYITYITEGCDIYIVDQNGKEYVNGDIVSDGIYLKITATNWEYYKNEYDIRINGYSYEEGAWYKVTGNVDVVANAIPMNSSLTLEGGSPGYIIPVKLNIYKNDTNPTYIYNNETLITTSTTSGAQQIAINLNPGDNYIEITGGDYYYNTYCITDTSNNEYNGLIKNVHFGTNYKSEIGAYAFYNSNVKDVYITKYITNIGNYAFAECSELKSIFYDGNIPQSTFVSSPYIFNQSGNLHRVDVSFGDTKTFIPDYLFSDSTGYLNVVLNKNIETISPYCFKNSRIENINLENIKYVDDYAFDYCTRLKLRQEIDLQNVITIGSFAFRGCGFTNIIWEKVRVIKEKAFYYCQFLTELELPNSLEELGKSAFADCMFMTKANIPSSVTTLGNSIFENCTLLSDINLEEGLTQITKWMFANCTGLSGAYALPKTIQTIGDEAFKGCTGLTNIGIWSNVTSIGEKAFDGCTNMGTEAVQVPGFPLLSPGGFIFEGKITPPSLGSNAFDNTNSCRIYIPLRYYNIYKNAWSAYNDRIWWYI